MREIINKNASKIIYPLIKERCASVIAVLLFLIFTVGSFNVYLARTLNGDVDKHILSGEMFGVPSALAANGVAPLFYGEGQTGWDGQFYYYMSNDVFARKDTAEHIDNPPYRYQRIGFSLFASIISKLLGKSWVSPFAYLIIYFTLVTFATYVGSRLLQEYTGWPLLILFWSLSVGTQVTLFNALPDAAADSFLIIGMFALHHRRHFWAAVFFLFAGLSREVYILFPASIYLLKIINEYKNQEYWWNFKCVTKIFKKISTYNNYLLSILGILIWQSFVYIRFGQMGGSDAPGILGVPFAAWWRYFISGIYGAHLAVGSGLPAYAEAFCLLVFLVILFYFAMTSLVLLTKIGRQPLLVGGIIIFGLALSVLYFSFGQTVIMHYTGYMKALSVFFFLLPLIVFYGNFKMVTKFTLLIMLFVSFIGSTVYQMKSRILIEHGMDKYTNFSKVRYNKKINCFEKYEAEIHVKNINILRRDLFNFYPLMVIGVRLVNAGGDVWVSSREQIGSVNLSYHWVDESGKLIQEGIRTAIPDPLIPGAAMNANIVTPLPSKPGRLIISPVQEGCSWFYWANKNSGVGLDFN